ncbi:MAG: BPTD_3080 family restriction endonuclease, partial [Promethearchaeota archaeon]
RRPAGYVIATGKSKAFDDPCIFIEIPLVNKIRPRVKKWRESGYPGVTGITKRLFNHWYDPEENYENRFFFCQLEAIETLIWLTESPDAEKVGIEIPSDGGEFKRLCSKMATGSGKTVVMAMLIAWQILNKLTYPTDSRFSKYIFVVAPGLTVKSRLQVLLPASENNYYDEFNVVPSDLFDKLYLGKIHISNWHVLQWETEEQIKKKRSVDKRGLKSDEAYVREVLEDLSNYKNILVINDEAHHAWRVPAESKIKGLKKEDIQEATIWIDGLDRIHKSRNILTCYDFSATPFTPTGKKSTQEALFDWIVSDFGLNDAIESGLVKTPRVVIRDDGVPDAKTYKSKLYHIYPHVKDDLNRRAKEEESLPDLIVNGYYLLGKDWFETLKKWKEVNQPTPPVMITVANRTETAARIKYSFDHKKIRIDELCNPELTLHIDSKVLRKAEDENEIINLALNKKKLTKQEQAELLRQQVDTIGRLGEPGEQIQNVISVGMLSEGWDTKTVTHIMGLRAFSSQLLCEQVVGRGLRRTSYDINEETGLFEPEYVNIFGVPFTFLPHESKDGPQPVPESGKTRLGPDKDKIEFKIEWPNVIRIEHVYKPKLILDMNKVKPLILNAKDSVKLAELASVIEGKPDITRINRIDLEELSKKFRLQKIIFETTRDVYDKMKPGWKANKTYLLVQLITLIEKFIRSDKIQFKPLDFEQNDLKRRILLTLNMNHIVQHIWEAIFFENTTILEPVFKKNRPIASTKNMRPWRTGKPCVETKKCHINQCVCDSAWESTEAFALDESPDVEAWVKNDHLKFDIMYIYDGKIRKYRPDFIIRLKNGTHLILETKGRDTQ